MKKKTKVPDWRQLDNAAKIFPPNSSKQDTKVFRFDCRLKEEVDAEILQKALDKTMLSFPLYASIIRKGLFWYYFEASSIRPIVVPEKKPLCSRLYNEDIKSLLFEVSYLSRRINLEIHHSLTDGVGALQFLRTLVLNYLTMAHQEELKGQTLSIDYDASRAEKEVDGFKKYYSRGKGEKSPTTKKAYKFKGAKLEGDFLQVINGLVSVKEVIKEAHTYNTTLTIYLTAILLYAISKQMTRREKKQPVVMDVPVNLRQYFQSASARNFFSVLHVPYFFDEKEVRLEDIIKYLKDYFDRELKAEKFQARMNHLVALEKNYVTRAIPLVLKKPTLQVAHYFTSKEVTTSFSNIGKVTMPKELEHYIDGFDVCVSTRRIQVCVCSYGDQLSISFTSPFVSTEVQKHFFRVLASRGIGVTINTNVSDKQV